MLVTVLQQSKCLTLMAYGCFPQLASEWTLSLLARFVTGHHAQLDKPLVIEWRFCEFSTQHAWLAQAAAQSTLRLVKARERSR